MHENYDLDLLLELVEQRKFRSLKELLSQMNEVDIAEFLDELDVEQEILVFRLLPKDTAAEVFTYLENTEDQEKLIGASATGSCGRCWTSCTWMTRWTSSRTCLPTWSPGSCATPTPPPAARSTSC